MFSESSEPLSNLTPTVFYDLGDYGLRIVKPYLSRHTSDMLKYSHQPFKQTLHVLSIIKLEIATVAVREAHYKVFSFVTKPAFNKVSFSEISLSLTRIMLQVKMTFIIFLEVKLFFPDRDIGCNQAVTTVKISILVFESFKDIFSCVPLFPWSLFIGNEPAVYYRLVGIKL